MSVHAFADESERRNRYVITAAVVDPSQLVSSRKVLRGMLLAGQKELHFKKESPQRRRLLVDAIVRTGVQVWIYTAPVVSRRSEAARHACLARLVEDLVAVGAHRLVLDDALIDRTNCRS
jgi:hypothetical protein